MIKATRKGSEREVWFVSLLLHLNKQKKVSSKVNLSYESLGHSYKLLKLKLQENNNIFCLINT